MPPTADLAISAEHLSKEYRLYERPIDRLKEALSRGRRTFHTPIWGRRCTCPLYGSVPHPSRYGREGWGTQNAPCKTARLISNRIPPTNRAGGIGGVIPVKQRTTGWWISGGVGAIVVVVAVVVYLGVTSRPVYTRAPARLERLTPAANLADVVPVPAGEQGAEEAYHEAVLALQDPSGQAAIRALQLSEPTRSPPVFPTRIPEYLLAGAQQRTMTYHDRYIPADQAVADALPVWQAFEEIAAVADLRARLHVGEGDIDRAEALYQAVVVFGNHILNDRVRYQGLLTGLTVQQVGLQGLFLLYVEREDTPKMQVVQAYSEALLKLEQRLDAKAKQTVFCLPMPAGDLINIARRDRDRAFRVEAIRMLGYCRWTRYASRGDRRVIEKLLTTFKSDGDPYIRAAAAWAADRTVLNVRELN